MRSRTSSDVLDFDELAVPHPTCRCCQSLEILCISEGAMSAQCRGWEAVWLNIATILGPLDGNAQLTIKSGRFLEDLLLVHG